MKFLLNIVPARFCFTIPIQYNVEIFCSSQIRRIHQELKFIPPIQALDQDISINSSVRYEISAGNDKNLFTIDPDNGTIFLERELDLESQSTNVFTLQVPNHPNLSK